MTSNYQRKNVPNVDVISWTLYSVEQQKQINWYHRQIITSIISQVSCFNQLFQGDMRQKLAPYVTMQFISVVNWPIDMRLQASEGIYKTFLKVKYAPIFTVPAFLTDTVLASSKVTYKLVDKLYKSKIM